MATQTNSPNSLDSGLLKSQVLHDLIMKDHADQTLQMNRKHLDHYRRDGLGMKTEAESEGEDMRILSAGDVHLHPQAQPQQQSAPQSTLAQKMVPLFAAAAIGSSVPIAAVAGYLLNKPAQPTPAVESTSTEKDYEIGEVVIE